MDDFTRQAGKLSKLLGLKRTPVAVAFLPKPPAGLRRVSSSAPAGCSYWTRVEQEGAFYTEASDHMGCPIGAHTHGVQLPAEKAQELGSVVGLMVGLEYIKENEVPHIARRQEPFGVAVYAPLDQTPCVPDVVIVRGNARQMMLVAESALSAGIGHEAAALGRPACSMIPHVMGSGFGATSLGCIGNRVYTGLSDDELYYALPGAVMGRFLERLETIVRANKELESFHGQRLAAASH